MMHDHQGKLAKRVRACLAGLGLGHLRVTEYGRQVFVSGAASAARLSHVEADLFGLAFRDGSGRWGTMCVIDTLEDIVSDLAAAIDVAPPAAQDAAAE
jgi:hypothetical protein